MFRGKKTLPKLKTMATNSHFHPGSHSVARNLFLTLVTYQPWYCVFPGVIPQEPLSMLLSWNALVHTLRLASVSGKTDLTGSCHLTMEVMQLLGKFADHRIELIPEDKCKSFLDSDCTMGEMQYAHKDMLGKRGKCNITLLYFRHLSRHRASFDQDPCKDNIFITPFDRKTNRRLKDAK